MIIKARAGKGGPALGRYLEQGKNEHAELLELRNLTAASLSQALYRMDTLAQGSHADKHALHVQMRAAPGERLTASHWREAVDRYAEEFGLQEHQTAVVLHHQPDGSTHCHAVFNRVHPETLKAVHLSQNYARHQKLARQMEQDWHLRQLDQQQKRERKRNYSDRGRGETEQAKRAGRDVHTIRERIRAAWEQAETGEDFPFTLAAQGFTLAQGDKRDFVAVDDAGHVYSIGSRTTGVTAATVREKLAGIQREIIPTIGEVRADKAEDTRKRQEREAQSAAIPFNAEAKADTLAETWNAAQERGARTTRYYANDNIRRQVWEEAAAARVERMRQRHARAYARQQERAEQAAKLERGEPVRAFNDPQRPALINELLRRQAEELTAELQRQQARRDSWDRWAARKLKNEYYAEQRATLEAQRREREQNAPHYEYSGFKNFLREELTRQRQQPAHIGATHDNTERPDTREDRPEQVKTRAEEYQEKMQQVRGQRRRRKPRRGPGED